MDRPHERTLEIEGEFLLQFDGGEARVDIRDETVHIRLPDARSALSMMRQVSPSTRREALRLADARLRTLGLVGRVSLRGRAIAELGGLARPSPLARLLGVDPLSLGLFSVIGAVLGRRRDPTSRVLADDLRATRPPTPGTGP